jgi:hypothetical protein
MAPVGLSKDAGWEIGVSKTLPYSVPELWEFVSSAEGIAVWLGEGAVLGEPGSPYESGLNWQQVRAAVIERLSDGGE